MIEYDFLEVMLSGRFWEIQFLSEKLTQTTTTDESALEKTIYKLTRRYKLDQG